MSDAPFQIFLAHESIEVSVKILKCLIRCETVSADPLTQLVNDLLLPMEVITFLVDLLTSLHCEGTLVYDRHK